MKKLTLVKLNKVIKLLISEKVTVKKERAGKYCFYFNGNKKVESMHTCDVNNVKIDSWLKVAEQVYYDNNNNTNILSTDKLHYPTLDMFVD